LKRFDANDWGIFSGIMGTLADNIGYPPKSPSSGHRNRLLWLCCMFGGLRRLQVQRMGSFAGFEFNPNPEIEIHDFAPSSHPGASRKIIAAPMGATQI